MKSRGRRRSSFLIGFLLGSLVTLIACGVLFFRFSAPGPVDIEALPGARSDDSLPELWTGITGLMDEVDPNRHSGKPEVFPEDGIYRLQAGSFQARRDADYRRATLILLGLDAEIRRVQLDKGEYWYRVVTGPVEGLTAVREVQFYLREQQIESIVLLHSE